jgi:hypothetical protein
VRDIIFVRTEEGHRFFILSEELVKSFKKNVGYPLYTIS